MSTITIKHGIVLVVAMATLHGVAPVALADHDLSDPKNAPVMHHDEDHEMTHMTVHHTAFAKGEATWSPVANADKIHVFYKESKAAQWQHAVRDLSGKSTGVTIGYLKSGVSYTWRALVHKTDGTWVWGAEMKLKTTGME